MIGHKRYSKYMTACLLQPLSEVQCLHPKQIMSSLHKHAQYGAVEYTVCLKKQGVSI